jgi:broad specificity phosphatase PhoE
MSSGDHVELWLVRHAESDSNRGKFIAGQSDVALTDLGHQQARQLAQRLRSHQFSALYTSDLQRARNTAGYVAEVLSMQPRIDPRLRELDAGAWSGLTHAQIAERFPEEWARWQGRDPSMRRGGGESYRDGAERITAMLEQIAKAHAGERVLVFSHGGVLGLYLSTLMGLDLSRAWHLVISNTAICRVRPFEAAVSGDHARLGRILSVNDLAHLDAGSAAVFAQH